MTPEKLLELIGEIIYQEGYQSKKGRLIKSSVMTQKKAINKIGLRLGFPKYTYEQVAALGYGN